MPIELDLTPQERRAQIIRNCGAKPIGEKPGVTEGGVLCWFTDLITKSTCLLPVEDVTEPNVRAKLVEVRKKFGLALVEVAMRNNADLRDQIVAALQFLTQTKPLPEEILKRAADAAFYEIVSFESETPSLVTDHSSLESEHHAA